MRTDNCISTVPLGFKEFAAHFKSCNVEDICPTQVVTVDLSKFMSLKELHEYIIAGKKLNFQNDVLVQELLKVKTNIIELSKEKKHDIINYVCNITLYILIIIN